LLTGADALSTIDASLLRAAAAAAAGHQSHPGATLYLVATPIGNLQDLSPRGAETLRAAAVVACEDTRHTAKLMQHLGLETRMVSYHEHNEAERTPQLIAMLEAGEDVALVSDAGMPLISDPGFRLVRAAREAGIRVTPVPGASAVVTALAGSGFAGGSFFFGGFLPRKSGEREKLLNSLRDVPGALVFFEAPHRIVETLREMAGWYGQTPVAVARELTKMHEEFLLGTAEEVADRLAGRGEVKGEITLVIGPREAARPRRGLGEAVKEYEAAGMSRMDAIKAAAREFGLPKRAVYAKLEES
jgi:16S rRNA (cytidine1402-2'-O)-methyltransferase